MTLESLNLSADKTKTTTRQEMSRDAEILCLANIEIKKRLVRGERMCKATEKFEDPKLQFFDNFLREEGFEGIDSSEAKTTIESDLVHSLEEACRTPAPSGKNRRIHIGSPSSIAFGSGRGYNSHAKIATTPNSSSQFVTVHKLRQKGMKKQADILDSSYTMIQLNKAVSGAQPKENSGGIHMTGAGPFLARTPTNTAAHEDDVTKAVCLAMEACMLDERGKA